MEDHVEQGPMHLNAISVVDEAERAKAIHEETDSGPGGADHGGESFLGDGWDVFIRCAWLVELRHNE